MEAVKRFFSSPRFAVAGASNDTNKFGYKSTCNTTIFLLILLLMIILSPRMVSPALAASHTSQPTSCADLPPLACLRYRPLA